MNFDRNLHDIGNMDERIGKGLRVKITLQLQASSQEFVIPINYNHLLSSFIYSNLKNSYPSLHDEGFRYEKRTFKLFTFSRLLGAYNLNGRDMKFAGPLNLVFSSVVNGIADAFAKSIFSSTSLKLGEYDFTASSIYVYPEPDFFGTEPILITTLSPITIYSTLTKADGNKKTYYYSPYEDEFSKLIESNAKKKYKALYGKEYSDGSLHISPIGKQTEVAVNYNGVIIRGWMGKYIMKGDAPLMKIAYYAGIGGKNSAGFGCFEVVGGKS